MAEGGLSIYISVFMLFAVCGLLFAVAVGGACGMQRTSIYTDIEISTFRTGLNTGRTDHTD